MNSKNGLDKCFEAFERLKANTPNTEKFKNMAPSAITLSIVSQEAGFDPGYLKKGRETHQPLVSLINAYKIQSESTSVLRKRNFETIKVENKTLSNENELLKAQLEAALGRELLLVRQLKIMEIEIKRLKDESNVSYM
jgi:hypothetical protein